MGEEEENKEKEKGGNSREKINEKGRVIEGKKNKKTGRGRGMGGGG